MALVGQHAHGSGRIPGPANCAAYRDGKDYLLIEAGGFDTKHGTAWTPPLLVLERE
jgi:hypothetical protein